MLITRLLVTRGNYRYCSFCSPFFLGGAVNLLLLDPGDSFGRSMKLELHVRRVVYNSSFFMTCYMDSFIVTCTWDMNF